ncbi:unnamed protein product [Heterotrigona itama]|uniref:Uncharacterized protein n=1 Tax=Heterotrigona itama TaxID=395501 RepID=A0A6V7GTU1_9HYME|nr:unnamed protein product [Heterotrigona itama]
MFFGSMEVFVINSYIIYKINSYIIYKIVKKKQNKKLLTYLKYVELTNNFRQDLELNRKFHEMCKAKKRDSVVCSNRQKIGERHETSEYCNTCLDKPRIYLGDYFSKYHKMKKFET